MSWLRVSTSSLTMVMRFSSRSTLTRMLCAATADSSVSATSPRGSLASFASFAGFVSLAFASLLSAAAATATGAVAGAAAALGIGLDDRRRQHRRRRRGLRFGLRRRRRRLRRGGRGGRGRLAGGQRVEPRDELAVLAGGLGLVGLELGEQRLDLVERRQDQAHRLRRHLLLAVAELARARSRRRAPPPRAEAIPGSRRCP